MLSLADGLAFDETKGGEAYKALASAKGSILEEGYAAALASGRQAEKLFKAEKDGVGQAAALRIVVKALLGEGNREEAAEVAKMELAAFQSSGNKVGEASMLLSAAEVYLSDPKDDPKERNEAVKASASAISLYQALGDKAMQAAALRVNAFSCCNGDNRGSSAIPTASAVARDICQELDDRIGEGISLYALATAQADAGSADSLEAALVTADEALDLFLEAKDKRLEAFVRMGMAKWRLEVGMAKKAVYDAEEAFEILQDLGSPRAPSALSLLVAAYMARGNSFKAQRAALRAVEAFHEAGMKRAEAEALTCLLHVYLKAEQFDDAMMTCEKALDLFMGLGDAKMESELLYLRSELHLHFGQHERAVQVGEDALEKIKELGDTQAKAGAMQTVAGAHLEKSDPQSALQVANEMRGHFQKEGDARGEAAALMCVCAVQFELGSYDQASSSASRAQEILAEVEPSDPKGQGQALRMIAEVNWQKKEYKAAIRMSERARTLFREAGEPLEEAAALFALAQSAVHLSVEEGAKVEEGSSKSRAAADALAKASKAAENSLKIARELDDEGEQLVASAQCILAQVHMFNNKPDDALAAADEAVVIFRENGDFQSEASALLLSADALRVVSNYPEATAAANEALALFQNSGDEKGEEMANLILTYIHEVEEAIRQQQEQAQQQQQMMWMQQQGGQMPQQQYTPVQEQQMPDAAQSIARQRDAGPRGPALDLSAGVDATAVKSKVLEIANRITGAEEGEIELDTPLMEAGLTSNSAILLRDELSQELPGVSLPVTLVFDYPSIAAMSELIVENSAKAIKR